MPWPDIFFRPRLTKRPESELPAPVNPAPKISPGLPDGEPEPESSVGDSHRLPVSKVTLPPAPVHPISSDRSVVQDMAEADTVRQLSRSGGVRLIKRDFSVPGSGAATAHSPSAGAGANPARSIPFQSMNPISPAAPAITSPATTPAEQAPDLEAPKSAASAPVSRSSPAINLSGSRETPTGSVYPSAMTIFRRRTKIADVARIVLPPRREEPQPAASRPPIPPAPAVPPSDAVPASSESTALVVPPAFPVSVTLRSEPPVETFAAAIPAPEIIATPLSRSEPESETGFTVGNDAAEPSGAIDSNEDGHTLFEETRALGAVEPVSPSIEAEAAEAEASGEGPTNETSAVDSDPAPASSALAAPDTREKREFFLANGERILGHILSETPEAIYVDHSTLGVLTIPRAQIALRPVEIILINGDRIVGDIIAETADSLFVKHSSLGILTVPRNQRSTRVVEAMLKDGDRILGEVLGETENFIVIRSATLGTVAVPHNRVAMLNRRAEQIEMKALPAPETKPAI